MLCCLPKDTSLIYPTVQEKYHSARGPGEVTYLLTDSLTDYSQAAIFLHEELGGAQAMGGALIVAANLLA